MNYRVCKTRSFGVIILLLLMFPVAPVDAQSAAFTYQGKLSDNGNLANGLYDFQFSLWDAASGGSGIGEINVIAGVTVANGIFTVTLNFGTAAFPGANRYLEIAVRPAGGGTYTTLSPRQPILPTPYSIKATAADGLSVACVSCVTSSQIGSVNGSAVSGMIPVASVPAGSSNYIQNGTSAQANSNFNISGNGIVGGNLAVGNAGTSARVFLNRASAVPTNSADINFISAGTPDFSMGTSQGSAAPSDFSIYNFGTGSNALTISRSTGFIGIGTTTPIYALDVNGGSNGFRAKTVTTSGSDAVATFENGDGIVAMIRGNGNVGIGTTSPGHKFHVNGTGANAFASHIQTSGLSPGTSYGLLISAGTDALDSALQIRDQAGNPLMRVRGNGYVGIGTTNPLAELHVAGFILASQLRGDSFQGGTALSTACLIDNLGIGAGAWHIGPCSSSLRYKTAIQPFTGGLDIIDKLRPITYKWKGNGENDLGLGAEDVEKIEPLLVTYNRDGQVEGVKYDRVGVVLINAVKEQQAQIEKQQAQIALLRAANDSLKQQNAALQQRNAEMDARLSAIERRLLPIARRASLRRSAKVSGTGARR